MTRKTWKGKIKKACTDAGTYAKHFDLVIDSLAEILERKDIANDQYIKSGGAPVVAHTNKFGAKNAVKNPALAMWIELDRSALAYWRDLGLTPSSYRKMTGETPKEEKRSALELALDQLETN